MKRRPPTSLEDVVRRASRRGGAAPRSGGEEVVRDQGHHSAESRRNGALQSFAFASCANCPRTCAQIPPTTSRSPPRALHRSTRVGAGSGGPIQPARARGHSSGPSEAQGALESSLITSCANCLRPCAQIPPHSSRSPPSALIVPLRVRTAQCTLHQFWCTVIV